MNEHISVSKFVICCRNVLFSKQMPNPAALFYISENWLWIIGKLGGGGGASESVRELKLGETDMADTKRTAVVNMNEENMDIFLWQLVISCFWDKSMLLMCTAKNNSPPFTPHSYPQPATYTTCAHSLITHCSCLINHVQTSAITYIFKMCQGERERERLIEAFQVFKVLFKSPLHYILKS